jgi:hypothetical protein
MATVMNDFPAETDRQVTLANWRKSPFNVWAFQHVREIVPTADIPNDPDGLCDFLRLMRISSISLSKTAKANASI